VLFLNNGEVKAKGYPVEQTTSCMQINYPLAVINKQHCVLPDLQQRNHYLSGLCIKQQ